MFPPGQHQRELQYFISKVKGQLSQSFIYTFIYVLDVFVLACNTLFQRSQWGTDNDEIMLLKETPGILGVFLNCVKNTVWLIC